MFRAMFSPIVRSTWLYLQYLVVVVSFKSFETQSGNSLGKHYQILQIQSIAADDGRKHCPKHVELTWNNKLIYIVAFVGYFHSFV